MEQLQDLPAFHVPDRPAVYERIRALLGWTEPDKTEKANRLREILTFSGLGIFLVILGFRGPDDLSILTWIIAGFAFLYTLLPQSIGGTTRSSRNDSRSIYTSHLHDWNKHFKPRDGQSRDILHPIEKRHVFDAEDDGITIDLRYEAPNLLKKKMFDTICYVYKNHPDNDEKANNTIGILWRLFMPHVQAIGSKQKSGVYLLPAGILPRTSAFTYYTTKEGYDVYLIGDEPPGKELDHMLELIRPLTEKSWQVGMEYFGGSITIYLPDFLPDYKQITTEEDLMHVCRRVDWFYSLLKRSLYWRYGTVAKWNKGE